MRTARFFSCIWLAVLFGLVAAKSSWSFQDATVAVQGKQYGGSLSKEKLTPSSPLVEQLSLGSSDTLKFTLTTVEDKKARRPHQAFLTLRDPSTGLEESFPLSIKESGKGKLDVTQKDLPYQLLMSEEPLQASLIIASFGASEPLNVPVFSIKTQLASNAPLPIVETPLRYGKLEEIHHIFRADPKSPPLLVTLVFTAFALTTLPALLGAWLMVGANVNDLAGALSASPVSHALFVGSIFALEGTFFLYYSTWNLFQTLPVAAAIGTITFLSGSRALSEVQQRRLVGRR